MFSVGHHWLCPPPKCSFKVARLGGVVTVQVRKGTVSSLPEVTPLSLMVASWSRGPVRGGWEDGAGGEGWGMKSLLLSRLTPQTQSARGRETAGHGKRPSESKAGSPPTRVRLRASPSCLASVSPPGKGVRDSRKQCPGTETGCYCHTATVPSR